MNDSAKMNVRGFKLSARVCRIVGELSAKVCQIVGELSAKVCQIVGELSAESFGKPPSERLYIAISGGELFFFLKTGVIL